VSLQQDPFLKFQSSDPSYSLAALARYFLKLGTIGAGGPVALVAHMYRDLAEGRHWIGEVECKEGLTLANSCGSLCPTGGNALGIRALPNCWRRGDVGLTMNTFVTSLLVGSCVLILAQELAMAETVNFDQEKTAALPAGWKAGVTGGGSAKWSVERDETAPSAPNVLKQSGRGTFPWCVKSDVSIENGSVEVKFKPISGREDAAGGLVWRWKDGNNYYVARANALEDNVSLYHTTNGRRNTIKYVDAPVAKNQWHTLKVEFFGKSIRVTLDGKVYIEQQDDHIAGAGAVGVWTKADSVTAFDDFTYSSDTPR